MAETSKIQQYFKSCFNKKLLIQKGIIAAAALVLVLIMSLSFYFWLHNVSEGTEIGLNKFWYIHIVWNDGIGFGGLMGNYPAIYALQSVMFILLLAIFLLVTHDKITSSFVALAMFGGLFNLIQRGASGTNCVLDYFQFGFWQDFPVFNWPDMFVVVGIFGFVISYITLVIIQSVRENKKEKDGQH
ncbi:MAG: signal peptidase II [Mycoplasma sp.]|nr:signal peptidase II [Candidatus Hennigella equi]